MAKINTNKKEIENLINSRYIEKIFPSEDFLKERLNSGKQVSIYYGIDPTGPDLHLGHSTSLLILKKFQALGHKTIIVIGDFTAQIGDPTGKDSARKPLTRKQVLNNAKTYKNQIGKILDLKKLEFAYNSRWLDKFRFPDVIKLGSMITVQQLLDRDMFQRRMKQGRPIGLHEFIYPLLQGYDSVALKIDGEIGGNDQMFNMLVGRDLEKKYLNKEKFVITTKLLINPKTKNKLMNKSEGTYISLQDLPNDMYAKVLSLPDEVVFECFELCTEVESKEIEELKKQNILKAKHRLAFEIVKMYHGEKQAELAEEEFYRVYKKKEIPDKIPEYKINQSKINIIDLLLNTGLVKSSSEAKRLINQNAVEVDGVVVDNWHQEIVVKNGLILKIGPRRFAKIIRH